MSRKKIFECKDVAELTKAIIDSVKRKYMFPAILPFFHRRLVQKR